MLDKMCNYMKTGNRKMLCAWVATLGGAHLLVTSPQPVLNFLPSFSFSIMGREVGAQNILGLVLTGCGVCCLMNCYGE